MLRIAAYVRISKEENVEVKESITNQIEIIKEYVEKNFTQYKLFVFEDDDFSGHSFDRPALNNMTKTLLKH